MKLRVLREEGTSACRRQETDRRRQVEGWCASSLCWQGWRRRRDGGWTLRWAWKTMNGLVLSTVRKLHAADGINGFSPPGQWK